MLIRTYTDFSAPQDGYGSSSFRAILKACLANGYGSFESFGWELVNDSSTESVFKSGSDLYLIVKEDLSTVFLTGCYSSESIGDYTFLEKHKYKFFPSYYQDKTGLNINKYGLGPSWTCLGNGSFFYFFSKNFFIFFGKLNLEYFGLNSLLIGTETFGHFNTTTTDHVLSKKSNGLFSPEYVGKKENFFTGASLEFSKVHLYETLTGKILGSLPNLFVSKSSFVWSDPYFQTTLGKKLLLQNFNNRSFLFDIYG